MNEIPDHIITGVIGIAGTMLGVVLGTTIDFIKSNIGKRTAFISNSDIQLVEHISDGMGGCGKSWIKFDVTFINRKSKNAILEKMKCIYYRDTKIICESECLSASSSRKYAGQIQNESIFSVDITSNASKKLEILSYPPDEAIHSDKIVFIYSYGVIKRKLIIWTK